MMEQLETPCAFVKREPFRPFIYGLVDPREPRHVRYVGMAGKYASRPFQHAENARKKVDKHSHLFHWIRSLQIDGLEPGVLILEELPEGAARTFVGNIEKMYILSLREIGHKLTNIAKGGDGGDTGPMSEETRKAISDAACGRDWSEKSRERLSNTLLGHKVTESARADMRRARQKYFSDPENRKKQSDLLKEVHAANPELGRAISAFHTGRKHTQETKEAIGNTLRGHKQTKEHLAAIKAAKEKAKLLRAQKGKESI